VSTGGSGGGGCTVSSCSTTSLIIETSSSPFLPLPGFFLGFSFFAFSLAALSAAF
jgi:hypothetical protein